MRQRKANINRATIAHANGAAKRIAQSYVERVENFTKDSKKDERLVKQICKTCFYFFKERMGGAAMTNRECGLCETDMLFSSTATDPLCSPCAKENGLCKQCGGDIESKERRKPYPFMIEDQELS